MHDDLDIQVLSQSTHRAALLNFYFFIAGRLARNFLLKYQLLSVHNENREICIPGFFPLSTMHRKEPYEMKISRTILDGWIYFLSHNFLLYSFAVHFFPKLNRNLNLR